MQTTAFQTLLDALEAAPAELPFATMWNDEDDTQSVNFGEFRRRAESVAGCLRSYGLTEGQAVILIMPQGISLLTAFVGAMLLGGIPAILAYPNFKIEPAKYRSGLAGVTANLNAALVVVDEDFPEELLEHVELGDRTQVVRMNDVLASAVPETLPRLSRPPESIAFIQHSAGTTGLQKGVALSHVAVLRQLDHLTQALRITEEDRIYSWLPLYHDMGLIACFILPLVYHLPVVMQSPTDWVMHPGTMLDLVTEYRCTLAWTPNFALQFLARRIRLSDRARFDLSSLRALINCSEPIRAQSIDEFSTAYSHLGLRRNAIQSSYAMAENVFAVTQSRIDEPPQRIWVDGARLRSEHLACSVPEGSASAVCLVSSGSRLPGNQIRIESRDGLELAAGAVGEICISGDSLFEGYYNRPDLTAEVLSDGFFRTGDLGFCLDEELYVIGRKKDLIIVGGKNIYPQDVEEIVWSHPNIRDGRVVSMGLFNPDLGTEDIVVVAEVDKEEDLENSREIERAVRNAIVAEMGVAARAVYLKSPRWIVKSTAGKPARAQTRLKLLSEHPELVHEESPLEARE
jgi:acyl-CoA synthetase (AMP-forming)/AMP-acid ligase II